jgi:hypothetical protein
MKLYSNGLGKWAGTQFDARQFGETYHGIETIDVPTDKPNLLAFLNRHEVNNADRLDHGQLEPEEQSTPKTVVNGWDLKAAADTASLQDLQYVVYKYLMRIDDEFDLKKENKA